VIAALLCCAPVDGQDAGERKTFRRGDANDDGVVNVLDALFVRDWQFAGGTVPSCLDAADANGNRRTDLGDPVFVLSYVFACGTPPPAPGPLTCGAAPEGDGPGCLEYDSCDVGGQGQRLPRTTDIKIWVEGPDPSSEPDDLWATVRLRDDSPPGSSGVSGWEIVLRTSCEFNAATAEVTEVGTVLVEDDGHVGDPFIDDVVGTFGGFVLLQFRPDEPFLRRSVDHAVLRFRIVPPPGGSVECDAIFDDSAVNPTCPTRRNFVLVGDELIRPVARGATLTFSRPAELSVDRDTPCEPATVELTPQAPTAIWEVTAPGDANALVLELTSTSDGAGEQREENILLARWGQPPTATSFDHAAASRPSAGQRLVVVMEGPQPGKKIAGMYRLITAPGYKVRNAKRAWGTFLTINGMIDVLSELHQKYPNAAPIRVDDLSRKGGGYLKPHKSHRTGRDIDIRYPLKKATDKYVKATAANIDLPRAWDMMHGFLKTGDMIYLFVDYKLQKLFYEQAKKQKIPAATLKKWFQYPRGKNVLKGIMRHEPGHATHVHVRFRKMKKDEKPSS